MRDDGPSPGHLRGFFPGVAPGRSVVNKRAPLKSASSWDPNTQNWHNPSSAVIFCHCLHNICFASGTTVWTHCRIHPVQVTSVTEAFEVRPRLHDPIGQRCAGRDPSFVNVTRGLAAVTEKHTHQFY